MSKEKASSRKRWTDEEISIVKSNWEKDKSVSENVKVLAPLLSSRTFDAVKREMYDFARIGIITIKQR
jgi:hypothetical protein